MCKQFMCRRFQEILVESESGKGRKPIQGVSMQPVTTVGHWSLMQLVNSEIQIMYPLELSHMRPEELEKYVNSLSITD